MDPFENYPRTYEFLRVGNLNRTMDDDTIRGMQRNRGHKGQEPAAIRRRYGRFKDFDWRVFTPRLVSRRQDGTHFVIDGNGSNHWVEALFGADTRVPTIVFEGLSLADEATLYIKAQDSKAMTKQEIFKAEVASGEETTLLLIKIAAEYGFEIDGKREAKHITKVPVQFVYDNFGDAGLRKTFEFVGANYAEDPESYNTGFFMGVGQAINREGVDPKRLALALFGKSSFELREGKSGYAGRDATRSNALKAYGE